LKGELIVALSERKLVRKQCHDQKTGEENARNKSGRMFHVSIVQFEIKKVSTLTTSEKILLFERILSFSSGILTKRLDSQRT
jgi:hypothetical protein